jgi:hypothetical protein
MLTLPQNQAIQQLDKVSQTELTALKEWLKYIEPFMIKSVSTYAQGRRELHLRHFVKLAGKNSEKLGDEVTKVPDSVAKKYKSELIESIGERLLPGFHEGLVLHYPKGTLIKIHRDSRAYDKNLKKGKGAASINVIGNAKFLISDSQDVNNLSITVGLGEGDCIRFDNNQPHAISKVQEDRWCVCFFYLKEEFLPKPSEQLDLFPTAQVSPELQFKKGDKIQYLHPKADGWINAIFEGFHTPGIAPTGADWSFIEVSVKGKLFKAFSLSQIRLAA